MSPEQLAARKEAALNVFNDMESDGDGNCLIEVIGKDALEIVSDNKSVQSCKNAYQKVRKMYALSKIRGTYKSKSAGAMWSAQGHSI